MQEVSILCDDPCTLGEGPFFCTRRNTLFWFDILNAKRHAYNFDNGQKFVERLPEMASAMAIIDDEADLIFTSSGLWIFYQTNGQWEQIAPIEADNADTRSNDARVHPSGAFWLGTMGLNAAEHAGSIYHFRNGILTKLFPSISIPNSICFSPDGKFAYFTDTKINQLMRVTVDPLSGLPTGEPEIFIDYNSNEGGLDGAITDAQGNIWIAIWGAGRLVCYDDKGVLQQSIKLPAAQTTCPVFVNNGKIAVTSAFQGMMDNARLSDPHAGKTFLIDANADAKFEPRAAI